MKKTKFIAQSVSVMILFHSVAPAATIYVDNQIADDCQGTYSIASRDNTGSDGDAYNTIQKAVNAVVAGDTVAIRGGIYTPNSRIYIDNKDGTEAEKIIFTNFNSEDVIIDGTHLKAISGSYYLLYTNQSDYLVFDGLAFMNSPGTGIRARESNYIEIKNCKVHSNGVPSINTTGIWFEGTSNGLIENCEVFGNPKGIIIQLSNGGPTGDNNIISNNLVYDNTKFPEGSDGIGISSGAKNTIVRNNVVFGNFDDGIDSNGHIPGSSYTVIENNIVFNNGDGPSGDGDGNGIKVSTNAGGGHTVRNNITFGNEGCGIDQCKEPDYPQNWFYNNITYNNTVHGINAESDADYLHEAAIAYNNILANNGSLDMKDRFSRSLNASDYNLWTTDWTNQSPHSSVREGPHSILANPQFNNPNLVIDTNFQSDWTIAQKMEYIRDQVKEKFSLQSGSPAIDNGMIIAGYHCPYADDDQVNPMDPQASGRHWLGNAPDIGAFEYGLDPYNNIDPEPKPDPEPEQEAEPEALIPDITALVVMNNIIKAGGNQSALIRCDMKEPGKLTVKIYDSKGKEIISVCDEQKEAGRHEFSWSGQDSAGSSVGSGIYMVYMKAGGYTETKKIAVVK